MNTICQINYYLSSTKPIYLKLMNFKHDIFPSLPYPPRVDSSITSNIYSFATFCTCDGEHIVFFNHIVDINI